MNRVSTGSAAVLAFLLLLPAATYAQTQPWPLKRTIDLSSGFGDFRPNRFHAGVDLRTGGAVGAEVFSPVNGYIMKVRMSYRGYGKGLYIRGDDRHIYVLGHLDRFADPLETAVRARQFQRERYYVEIDFPKDSIRVKQGQLVAYAGKTGIGAPHLHFEKRTPDNVPIDPLNHGFVLDDTTPPTFERIGFHLLDDRSLFSNGRRKVFYPVRRVSATEYVLDTVLYLNAPFGVLAHCYDQMREGGMRQAVKKLTLTVDGEVLFESDLDSLPFETGSEVNLTYDANEAAGGEKRVRRLYRRVGSLPGGASDTGRSGGIIKFDHAVAEGLHECTLIAEDYPGNTSVLSFAFRKGQLTNVSPGVPLNPLRWGIPADTTIISCGLDENGLEVNVDLDLREHTLDTMAVGLVGGGSRLAVFADTAGIPPSLGFFFPITPEFGRVSEIVVFPGVPLPFSPVILAHRNIFIEAMGYGADEEFMPDSFFTIRAKDGTFFDPCLVAVEESHNPTRGVAPVASSVYRLLPDGLPLRGQLELSIKLDPGRASNKQTGLCWYDMLEEEWVWIDDETEDENLAAGPSLGGGLFAAIVDSEAPTLTDLNLKRGHRYWNRQPRVKFKLEDNLSGFEDDRSLDVRIDGQWLLPEFDIEDGDVVATLREPLALGNHVLTVSAVDRAGNKVERRIEFEVIRKSN
jgi:hypothetical protein